MTVGLSDRLRKIRRAVLVAIGVAIAVFQLSGVFGLRINTSPSLPMGLYIITADAGANLVEFCPAEPFATLSIVRGYRDPGACRDGAAPLLKPVIASVRRCRRSIRTRNLREWSTPAEHGPAHQGYKRQASRSVAIRAVCRGPRNHMGCVLLSSAQL